MKSIWRSSIARSLFGGFLLFIIPSLLISFAANYYSMTSARDVVMHSYENYMSLLCRQFDDRLSRFQSLGHVLLADSSINYINEYSMDDEARIQGYVKMLQQLELLAYSNEFEGEITVYLKNKARIMSSRLGIARLDPNDATLQVVHGSNRNGIWHVTDNVTGKRLTYILNPSPSQEDKNIIVRIDVNTTSIRSFLLNLDVPGNGAGFLVDGSGSIIEGGNPYGVSAAEMAGMAANSSTQYLFDHDGRTFQVLAVGSNTTGLKLVMYFPQDLMTKPVVNIRNWLIAAAVLSLALALVFTLRAHRRLLLPIQRLIGGMRQVSAGDLKVRILEDEKEELGFMFHQFNSMTERIHQLVNEVYAEKIKNQQAQLDFLQSQINPHFLYNCLYTTYHLINSDDKEAAGRMTLYLGDYFRFTTGMNKDTVTVQEEMAMIETYINIQMLRYPDKIAYHCRLPESVLNTTIPRLIIQPVVENAIVHGLEKANRNGSIWIDGEALPSGGIRITVQDDGKGMADHEVARLQQSLESEEDSTAPGYGLINTHRRIRLGYGSRSGLTVERRQAGGVAVTILLQGKEVGQCQTIS